MAIQYVGGNTATKAGATNGTSTIALTTLTGGLSASAAAGDLVIAVFATGSTADRALSITDGTTEYTLVGTELYANGTSYDTNLRVAYKLLTAADASVTFGATGNAADAGAMAVHVWRGVDSSIFDATATTATGTGTGRPTPPAITPSTAGTVIVMAGGAAAATGAVFTASALSNFRTATSADTQDASVGVGSFDWTSGTYTPAQWTGGTTGAADSWAAVTMALKAAPQVLTAPLTTNSQTFHAATVTNQNQVLLPTLVDSGASLFAPLVTRSSGIRYLGSATTTVAPSTGTNTTLSLTSIAAGNGAQAGDLVVAFYATESSNVDRTLSITDGTTEYTLVDAELYSTDGTGIAVNLRVAYKYLTAADTSVTLGPTGSTSDYGVAGVQVWRGVDPSQILDVAATTSTGATTLPDPPAIAPTTAGAMVVAVGAGVQNTSFAAFSSSDLGAFVTRPAATALPLAQIGFGSIEWVSGTVDPAIFAGPASVVRNAAITLALRPASTGDQTLTPTRYDNAQTFYAPTVTPGEVSLTPSLFSNNATFYAATVATSYTLTASRLDNAQTFFSASIAGSDQLEAAAASASSASASLTTAINLFGSAAATSTSTATVTTAIYMDAIVQASAALSAALTTQIRVAAAVAWVTTTGADLAVAVRFATTTAGSASTSAALTTQVLFGSDVAAATTTAGNLTVTPSSLAADCAASTAATGALTAAIRAAASAAATTTTSAALTTVISLVASTTAQTNNVLASLNTGIPLVGAGAATATGVADLQVGAGLSAAAAAVSTSSAAVSTAIHLAGALSAAVIPAGALSTAVLLNVVAVSQGAAQGVLSTGALLAGGAVVQADAQAELKSAIQLTGVVSADVTAVATLETGIALGSQAVMASHAAGSLSVEVRLAAAVGAVAVAAAEAATAIWLSGDGEATAVATGGLLTQIGCAGSLAAQASAQATLTHLVVEPDPDRIVWVAPSLRRVSVDAEQRLFSVLAAPRWVGVDADQRLLSVRADSRVLQVEDD